MAVFRAVSYADIFGFPLTSAECSRRAIGCRVTPRSAARSIGKLADAGLVVRRGEWVTLRGRGGLVARRRRRTEASARKTGIALSMAAFIGRIPTVTMVGVTGGVAAGNADSGDDIDLLVVAAGGTVWMTRLMVTVLAQLRFTRRHPGQREIADAMCLNMFMSDGSLAVPVPERDVYSAHEVAQMRPVFDRGGTAARFFRENIWIRRYLPNWRVDAGPAGRDARPGMGWGIVRICRVLEPAAYGLQRLLMAGRRTSEVTDPGYIRFHPMDARGTVLPQYGKRLAEMRIHPLDKKAKASIK